MIESGWQKHRIRKGLGLLAVVAGAALAMGCEGAESETEESVAEASAAVGQAHRADWTVIVTTAPGLPQDVWIAAHGNDTDGWHGGGSVCLGVLANDLGPHDPQPAFEPGDHATLITTVVSAGVFGVDGTPVAAGDYFAPGSAADASPGRDFTLANGQSYFVIFDGLVQNSSNPAAFPFPVGSVLRFMFTFDYSGEGRQIAPTVLWVGIPAGPGYLYFPFLNEGNLMLSAKKN